MSLSKFQILESDTLFGDSPDAGMTECFCSRCGKQIAEDEVPLRAFVDEGKKGEYRYCENCYWR